MSRPRMGNHFADLDAPVREGLCHLADPWATLAFVLASLALLLFTSSLVLPALVVIFCMSLLLNGGVPLTALLRKLALPAAITLVLLLTQLFTYGETPLFRWRVLGKTLVGYREGLLRGGLMLGRALAGVALLVFLTSLIPVYRLLECAGRLGISRLFILQCFMVYRFAALLISEMARIHDAQTVRLGRTGFRGKARSLQLMATSVVLRSLERSANLYDGARMRGAGAPLSRRAVLASTKGINPRVAVLLSAAFALFVLAGRVFHVAA